MKRLNMFILWAMIALTAGLSMACKDFASAFSDETEIISFTFSGIEDAAVIDKSARTITAVADASVDLTQLVVLFELSEGAVATVDGRVQQSGVTANDFSKTVVYAVTSGSEEYTRDWKVTITQEEGEEPGGPEEPEEAAFLEFKFDKQRGTSDIDAKKRTVKAVAECGTDIKSLVAEFKLSPDGTTAKVNAKTQTSGTTAQNFTNAVVYTLATTDGTTAEWTVTIALPDDCPTAKKYITYNKPVTAYYIEYNGGAIEANQNEDFPVYVEAYENKEYARIEWWENGPFFHIDYYFPNGTTADAIYGSTEWYQGDGHEDSDEPDDEDAVQWRTYPCMEYPLEAFAHWVTKDKTTGGIMMSNDNPDFTHLEWGGLWTLAQNPDRYELPNHTDVTEYYIRSEKVMDILCDVYQDKIEGVTCTFWVDPVTGFTLKNEETKDGEVGDYFNGNYEVTKLIVGKPEWDSKHLHPLATDKWITE